MKTKYPKGTKFRKVPKLQKSKTIAKIVYKTYKKVPSTNSYVVLKRIRNKISKGPKKGAKFKKGPKVQECKAIEKIEYYTYKKYLP